MLNSIFGFGSKSVSQDSTERKKDYNNPDSLINRVVEDAENKVSSLIVLRGSIVENYSTVLTGWAERLARKGAIRNATVKKLELLSVLSSQEPVEPAAKRLIQGAAVRDCLYYINGFHQMEYNEEGTAVLVNKLVQAYENISSMSPVVLNIPAVAWEKMLQKCPELQNKAVCLVTEIIKPRDTAAEEVNKNKYPSQSLSSEQQSREREDHNRQTIAPQTEKTQRPQREKSERMPWYTKDLQLLKIEKDGMAQMLRENNSNDFELTTVPGSKRLCWKFSMKFFNLRMNITIVYSESFSASNPSVGISVHNIDRDLDKYIQKSRWCEGVIVNDPEFSRIYIIKPLYVNQNRSAAAAVLKEFIDILEGLR